MDRPSHWASTDVGPAGFHQAATTAVPGGTAAPSATVASHQGTASPPPPPQGWALAIKQAPQQAQGGEGWGTSTSSSSSMSPNENAGDSSPLLLDETINRFGGMTLGTGPDKNGFGAGAIVECQHAAGFGGGGGVDGLDMDSLRLAEEAGGAGACFNHHHPSQPPANPFLTPGQQQASPPAPPAQLTDAGMAQQWRAHQQRQAGRGRGRGGGGGGGGGGAIVFSSATGVPDDCPSCGRQYVGGGRGPDGIWRDEGNRRLYTETEVREALENEGRELRDKTAALEASLAKMESDAKAALLRAEHAVAEMAEQLRASESKTYALSVHLAKSNRPSHLA